MVTKAPCDVWHVRLEGKRETSPEIRGSMSWTAISLESKVVVDSKLDCRPSSNSKLSCHAKPAKKPTNKTPAGREKVQFLSPAFSLCT
jgi:hypothetical protein